MRIASNPECCDGMIERAGILLGTACQPTSSAAAAAAAGYVGTVTEVSPVCYSDPGMTNANMQFAVVEVDADAPENADVNPELEVTSSIASILIIL